MPLAQLVLNPARIISAAESKILRPAGRVIIPAITLSAQESLIMLPAAPAAAEITSMLPDITPSAAAILVTLMAPQAQQVDIIPSEVDLSIWRKGQAARHRVLTRSQEE